MKQTRRIAPVLAMIAWAVTGTAAAEPDVSADARKLYEVSGLDLRVGMIDDRILQRLRAAPDPPPAAALDEVVAVVNRVFGSDALGKRVLARLEAAYDPALAAETFTWIDSDLGEKVLDLEKKGSSTEFEAIQKYAETLAEKPPPAARATLIRRVDIATGATETGVDVAIATGLAVQTAAGAARGAPVAIDALRTDADAQRPQLFQMFGAINLAGLLYTFRSLSDAELIEYLRFAESDAGKWYSQTTEQSFSKSLLDASDEFAKELSHGTPKNGQ